MSLRKNFARAAARFLRWRGARRRHRRRSPRNYHSPIYVRKEIVHNKHVVQDLRERGAVFVDEIERNPRRRTGQTESFASFRRTAFRPKCAARRSEKNLFVIDATCPLVTKVHMEAIRFAKEGYSIISDRPQRPRRSRGHDGRSALRHNLGRIGRRRRKTDPARPRKTDLSDANHVERGRHRVDHRGAQKSSFRR